MRVDYQVQNQGKNPNAEHVKTSNSASAHDAGNVTSMSTGGIQLDITGTVKDNAAYGGEKKTAQDIMQDAGQQDAALLSRFRTVMSNFMSSEDYAKLQEEGQNPGAIPPEEMVTMLDRIKVTLAQAGVNVEGFTDEVSMETLKAIAGETSRAMEIAGKLREYDLPDTRENIEAVSAVMDQASRLEELSPAAVKYMVENQLSPTVDNIYRAEHSVGHQGTVQGQGYYREDAGVGYYAKKAETPDWNQLDPQIGLVIEQAGFYRDGDSLEQGRWLVAEGVPLTEETFTALMQVRQAQLPASGEQVMEAAVKALANGRQAKDALLYEMPTLAERSIEIAEAVQNLTAEDVDALLAAGRKINIGNLIEIHNKGSKGAALRPELEMEAVRAKRQLEEIRLMMTAEANLSLLKRGFSIDTSELSQVVEQLKAREEQYHQELFADKKPDEAAQQTALWQESTRRIADLPSMPADVLGGAVSSEDALTLRTLHEEGSSLQEKYRQADKSYEALRTEPRRDMGDSIKEAFRSVDSLLQDIGLEANEANRRAARILGYNSMEITEEAIQKVKEADAAVGRLMDKMTPAATLSLIREGINPLDMPIQQLNEEIDSLQDSMGAGEESYSKFLWKLEKNNEISDQEREAYIGIYRLFRQIDKSDGSVIGSLLQQDARMSLQNLLTASRTRRHGHMDISVDDEFGALHELIGDGKSISAQIEAAFSESGGHEEKSGGERASEQSYYETLVKESLDTMEPGKLKQSGLSGDMSLEEFSWRMREQQDLSDAERAYNKEQYQQFKSAAQAEEAVLQTLANTGQPVTADNIFAMQQLIYHKGELFRSLNEDGEDDDGWQEDMEQAVEQFTDEESAKESYERLVKKAVEKADALMEKPDMSYIDLKAVRLLHKQISLAGSMAKEECYEIPVKAGGRLTAMNVRIVRGGEDGGKAVCTMETEAFGKVKAEFILRESGISGYMTSETDEGVSYFQSRQQDFSRKVKEETGLTGQVSVLKDEGSSHIRPEKEQEAGGSSAKALYKTARAFVVMVSEYAAQ